MAVAYKTPAAAGPPVFGGLSPQNVTKDTNYAANNLALLAVASYTGAINQPTGWTPVPNCSRTNGATIVNVYYRFLLSGDTSFAISNAAGQYESGGMVAFSGVDLTTPIDASNSLAGDSAPSVTTDTQGCYVVRFFAMSGGAVTWSPPSLHTERFDSSSSYTGIECADSGVQSAAGATGTATAVPSVEVSNGVSVTVALKPSVTGIIESIDMAII